SIPKPLTRSVSLPRKDGSFRRHGAEGRRSGALVLLVRRARPVFDGIAAVSSRFARFATVGDGSLDPTFVPPPFVGELVGFFEVPRVGVVERRGFVPRLNQVPDPYHLPDEDDECAERG